MSSTVNLDIEGAVFSRWTVLRRGPKKLGSEIAVLCRCECGSERWQRPSVLKVGDSKSCGCLRAEMVDGSRFVGKRYGLLTVLEKLAQRDYGGAWLYRCRCDCGTEKVFASKRFAAARRGVFQSCGCKRGVRLPKGESGFNVLFGEYRRGALTRGMSFSLTKDEFRAIVQQDCFYCGAPPAQVKKCPRTVTGHSEYLYNGIDRVDNATGYNADNAVPCCSACNVAKGTMAQAAFLLMVARIAAHLKIGIEP